MVVIAVRDTITITKFISVAFLHHTSLELSLTGSKARRSTRNALLGHLLNDLVNTINLRSMRGVLMVISIN